MKIVIDIDDNLYTRLFDKGDIDAVDMLKACVSIRKGTPLPKGHGRLIDESKIAVIIETEDGDDFITDAPTIIEADMETDDYYRGAQEEY